MFKFLMARILSSYVRSAPAHRGMFPVVRLLSSLCPGQPIASKYGVKLACRPRDKTFLFAVLGRYGAVHDFLAEHLGPGKCLVDIGANQGVFTLVGAKRVGPTGRVLSFEPSRREFGDLLRNLEFNRAVNVVPFMAGLSDVEGAGALAAGDDRHSGKGHYVANGGDLSLQLDLRRLDSLLHALIGDRETWIKIDVEGYEWRVVRSLDKIFQNPLTKGAAIEIDAKLLGAQGASPAEVYSEMARHGFAPLVGLNDPRTTTSSFCASEPDYFDISSIKHSLRSPA